MRLLDRYLLRELLIIFCFCLGGLLISCIAFDLIDSLHRFQERQLHGSDVFELYLVRLPEILVFILPIVLLVALLYALTNHARHNELTAMRAAGVGLGRICAPYFVVGFLLSIAVFAMNELWVPDSQARVLQIMNSRDLKDPDLDKSVKSKLGFANAPEGRNWLIGEYDFRTDTMYNPIVSWSEDGTNWTLLAQRASRIDGVWTFYGETNNKYPVRLNKGMDVYLDTNRLAMPQFNETPKDFANEAKFNNRLGTLAAEAAEVPIVELLDYRRVHPDMSKKHRWWVDTQLQGRLADPWRCLVVVLVAIPCGAASGRRNIFVGVAGAIGLCFVYFVVLRLGLALGTGGYLPAIVAAWLPNAAFGIAGFWMMLRVR